MNEVYKGRIEGKVSCSFAFMLIIIIENDKKSLSKRVHNV